MPRMACARLPVARSPAGIAQAERIDLELAVVAVGRQLEFPGRMAELFQMALCELSLGITGWFRRDPLRSILFAQLASPTWGGRDVVDFERGFRVGIGLERLGRIGHLERVFQNAEFAAIADAMALERFNNFKFCAAGVLICVVF